MGKPKKILFELIKPEDQFLSGQPYELLAEIRAENHFDTAAARIALAWRKGTKPNADGKIVLGRCVKASDLQRELVDYDFVIVLNKEFWEDPEFDREKKLALLDHEMCHAARATDEEGVGKIDSKGRPVWRSRGHDVEEFEEIITRHGVWKRDLERFAEAIAKRKKSPLFSGDEAAPVAPNQALVEVAQSEIGRDPQLLAEAHRLISDASTKLADDPKIVAAVDRMTSGIRKGEFDSLTISTPGREPVVIDKEAAERIHRKAKEKH